MLRQKRWKVQCQSDSAVSIRLIKVEPGGRSTSQIKASVNMFIPEKIQWKWHLPYAIIFYFNFSTFKTKFSCVSISCNTGFCLKSLGSEVCQLHSSACVLYTEASEVLLEFQRFQLIYKLGEEGQALGGKYREHRMEEQFGRKEVLTVPCASHHKLNYKM